MNWLKWSCKWERATSFVCKLEAMKRTYIWGLFTEESCRIRRNNAYCCDGCVLYTRRENTTWIIEQAGMMQVVQRYYRRIKNACRAKFCKLNEKSVMLVQFRYSTNSLYKLPSNLLLRENRASWKREWTLRSRKNRKEFYFFLILSNGRSLRII